MLLLPALLLGQSKKVIVYYDNAQKLVKEVYYVEDTINMELEGLYQAYYTSGQLKEKGNYHRNEAVGYWQYFYENGNIKMQGELKEGSNFGHWQYFYENGNLSMEGPIFEGMRQDEWTHYYENGNIKRKGRYLNNRKVGIWNYFYESTSGGSDHARMGPLKAQAFYENGKGTYKEYYQNGGPKAEGVYVDGRSEGEWIFYHPNGSPEAKGMYENGLRTGVWQYFHDNGQKSAEGTYVNGLRQGKWTFYHSNGNLSSEGRMEEDRKDGYWKLFNRWGEFKGEGNFVKGEGEYKEFYENGKLKTTGIIRNDQNEGEWLYYYENGRLEGRAYFEQGKGYYTGYYPDGTKNMEGEITNGQRTGIWKMYKGSGELSGFYKVYYENEKPVYKIIDSGREIREGSDKPEYRFKVKTFRNFKPQVNEFKALILATNPFATLYNGLPVSAEYYIQERLGYELQLIYLRDPFFLDHQGFGSGREYSRGFSFALKQKLYQPEDKLGMFYYGHEMRVSPITHFYNSSDVSVGDAGAVSMNVVKLEYSVIFGNRLTQDAGKSGITVDIFMGLGAGYRFTRKNYQEEELNEPVFTQIGHNGISVPVRFGFNFGYAFNRLKKGGKN